MIVYDDTTQDPVRIFDSGASRCVTRRASASIELSYRTGDIVSPRIDATEPLALELADFCSAIVRGTPLRSSCAIGLDVVRSIEMVDRSLAAAREHAQPPAPLAAVSSRRGTG